MVFVLSDRFYGCLVLTCLYSFCLVFGRRAFRRVARFFGAGKKMPNIKELGVYAILSYGFVSNASYAICIGLAWFASSKKTGRHDCAATNR